jgi:hypothetical protein
MVAEGDRVCEWHRERQFKYVALKRCMHAICERQRTLPPGEQPPPLSLMDEISIPPKEARQLVIHVSSYYREIPVPGVEWALTRSIYDEIEERCAEMGLRIIDRPQVRLRPRGTLPKAPPPPKDAPHDTHAASMPTILDRPQAGAPTLLMLAPGVFAHAELVEEMRAVLQPRRRGSFARAMLPAAEGRSSYRALRLLGCVLQRVLQLLGCGSSLRGGGRRGRISEEEQRLGREASTLLLYSTHVPFLQVAKPTSYFLLPTFFDSQLLPTSYF